MTEELKPCPFCGAKAVARHVFSHWEVSCDDCMAEINDGLGSEEAAVSAWNRRAALSQPASPAPEAMTDQDARELVGRFRKAVIEYTHRPDEDFMTEMLASQVVLVAALMNLNRDAGAAPNEGLSQPEPPPLTQDAFIAGFIDRSKVTRELFDQYRVALPCDCGDPACAGWAAVRRSAPDVLEHLGFRTRAPEEPTDEQLVDLAEKHRVWSKYGLEDGAAVIAFCRDVLALKPTEPPAATGETK